MPRPHHPLAARLSLISLTVALMTGCGSSEASAPTTPEPTEPPVPESVADPSFIEAYSLTYRFNLGNPGSFAFTPDGTQLLFLRAEARRNVNDLYSLDLASGTERVLLTADQILNGAEEELSDEERARRERTRSSARGIASYDLSPDGNTILVPLSGRLFLVDRLHAGETGSVRELTSAAGFPTDPRFSPDGTKIAVVRDRDLFVIDVASGAERRITESPRATLTYGSSEFVAQEEMGRMEGYWWSPDSRTLLVEEADTDGVEPMTTLDFTAPASPPASRPYPRPGQDNAVVRLGIVAATGGAMRFVQWDRETYPYLATVRWPENRGPVILVQDRLQEHELLLSVDPSTGTTQQMLLEEDAAWLNLDQDVPRFLSDGTFLWTSEREGSTRLELRGADGSLLRALTPRDFGYTGLLAVDPAAGAVFVSASRVTSEAHLYRIALDGSSAEAELTPIDTGEGIHEATFSEDGTLFVEIHRSLEGARVTTVRRADGTSVATPASRAEDPAFAPSVTFERVGERDFAAAVVRPRNFQEGLRYPVLLYVYAGPTARMVLADRDRWLLPQWFADHGFIVVSIDGRGTPGRGRDWERSIDGDFATIALEDQVAGLTALGAAHPEMDMERVGVYGWSFGGYFSAMAALRRPDVFRAGIAGAPVTEWRDYDTHYTERYVGLPEAEGTAGAYSVSSVLTYATPLEAEAPRSPLLIIHGTTDDNVYFSHAIRLCDALFRAGRPFELLPMVNTTHMPSDPALAALQTQRMIGFFEQHLVR